MSAVDLRTGYACNNRCRFCDQGDARERLPEGTLPELRAALEAAREAGGPGVDAVWLAGGEVTVRRDLPALVTAAREAGYRRVGVQTNGRILATAGAATALRARGLTDAAVAIHAGSAAVHDWLTGEAGSWAQAVRGAQRLAEAGVTVHLSTVVTRSVVEAMPALVSLATKLRVSGHRWILCRSQGAAGGGSGRAGQGLVPRLSLVREPLGEALRAERDARIEPETFGVPLCMLGAQRSAAGDRADVVMRRAFVAGREEVVRASVQGPPCAGCPMASACRGVDAAYAERWGWDEVAAVRGAVGSAEPTVDRGPLYLPVVAPCALGCEGCAARGDRETETTRLLRQRLVRAARERERGVVFAGASPWSHPGLPVLVREAVRLGFASVGVRGPLHPVAGLDDADLERLEGLTRVEVPALDGLPGAPVPAGADPTGAALARLRGRAPALEVVHYPAVAGGPPPGELFDGVGPRGLWAPCQRASAQASRPTASSSASSASTAREK